MVCKCSVNKKFGPNYILDISFACLEVILYIMKLVLVSKDVQFNGIASAAISITRAEAKVYATLKSDAIRVILECTDSHAY